MRETMISSKDIGTGRYIPKTRWLWPILGVCLLAGSCLWTPVLSREIEATNEWQVLGENDTVAAGMHIRMDMTTGEKWVKLPDDDGHDDDDDDDDNVSDNGIQVVGAQHESSSNAIAAVVQPDGSIGLQGEADEGNGDPQYDYNMMHRTLSKLPAEEMERYGGLPELPETQEGAKRVLTSKERQAFEERMAQIWEKRQAELQEVQAMLMDVPEVLKERMKGIQYYLKEPLEQLRQVDLYKDDEDDLRMVTDIISLLKDLEYQLTDVDNARDFHTMGGWDLLVSLLSEDMHVQNRTISKLSGSTEGKIRAVQAHAAWTIGTAVKNTGEFAPFAVEPIKLGAEMTTAFDMLLEIFCRDYEDEQSWPIRTLLAKSIYGLGSLLRGNRLSQYRLVQIQGASRLNDKLRLMVRGGLSSDVKLIQRMLSLASDLITDIQLDGEESTSALNEALIEAFTTTEWCEVVSMVLVTDTFLPVRLQETVMETVHTMAPYCGDWKGLSSKHRAALERFQKGWEQNREDFDPDHLQQLMKQATEVKEVLS